MTLESHIAEARSLVTQNFGAPVALSLGISRRNSRHCSPDTFATTSSAPNLTLCPTRRLCLTTQGNFSDRYFIVGAARPTMGTATGTVRISTYAMPPSTPVRPELVEGLANQSTGTNANLLTTTPGLVGLATFQISVLQQSDGPTQFTGKILDHTGKPLQGVRVTISRTPLSVTTDAAGNFNFLQDVPHGKLDLFVDGRAVTGTAPLPAVGGNTNPSNSTTTPTQYPSLHFEVLAIRGQKNILPHPIYLPPILMSQAKIVGGNEDVSLTIPGRDGFEMIVKANSVTFPDGTRIGPLVVSPVADDRLPMSPPGGAASFMPGAAATLQPSGTRFDPPIEVRLANTSGYAPGERVPVYHWDYDIGQFVAMGQARVTDDGAQLITDPGSAITKAGWHGPPPPPPPPDCAKNSGPTEAECDEQCRTYRQENSSCGSRSYCLRTFNGLTKESASCCGGDKYNNQAQCCVKLPLPGTQYIVAEKNKPFAEQPNLLASISNDVPPAQFVGQPQQSTVTPLSNRQGGTPFGSVPPNNTAVEGCSVPATLQTIFPPGLFINKGDGAIPPPTLHPNAELFYEGCKEHDVCYQTCGSQQGTCDATLRQSLIDGCSVIPDAQPGTGFYRNNSLTAPRMSLKNECLLNAEKVYSGLSIGGKAAHSLRQRERCDVCR